MAKKHPTPEPFEPFEAQPFATEPEPFVEPEPAIVVPPVTPKPDVEAWIVALIKMRDEYAALASVAVDQNTTEAVRVERDYNKSIAESIHLREAIEHLGFLFKQLEPSWPARVEPE